MSEPGELQPAGTPCALCWVAVPGRRLTVQFHWASLRVRRCGCLCAVATSSRTDGDVVGHFVRETRGVSPSRDFQSRHQGEPGGPSAWGALCDRRFAWWSGRLISFPFPSPVFFILPLIMQFSRVS